MKKNILSGFLLPLILIILPFSVHCAETRHSGDVFLIPGEITLLELTPLQFGLDSFEGAGITANYDNSSIVSCEINVFANRADCKVTVKPFFPALPQHSPIVFSARDKNNAVITYISSTYIGWGKEFSLSDYENPQEVDIPPNAGDTSLVHMVCPDNRLIKYSLRFSGTTVSIREKASQQPVNLYFTQTAPAELSDRLAGRSYEYFSWPARPQFELRTEVTLNAAPQNKYVYEYINGEFIKIGSINQPNSFDTYRLGSYVACAEKIESTVQTAAQPPDSVSSYPASSRVSNPFTGR